MNKLLDKLKERCLATEAELVVGMQDVGGCWFKDNGGSILAVAHMDSVQEKKDFGICKMTDKTLIFSPTLDNRLGVFTILDLLPKLGIVFDVLLTTDEEICNSTASKFETVKDYNWIFSFDRAGTDVVTYDYDEDQWEGAIKSAGFELGIGSYSDICELEHLGCSAANFGDGLVNGHSEYAFTVWQDYVDNVNKFLTFYTDYAEIDFPHLPLQKPKYNKFSYLNRSWDFYDRNIDWAEFEARDVRNEKRRKDNGRTAIYGGI
jgi:hypothetical protein